MLIAAAGLSVSVCSGSETPAAQAKKALLARDYAGAAALFGKAAAAGDPEGEVGLGFLHHTGLGVQKDLSKAFSCFSKAAEKKYPKGVYFLGRAYKTGAAGRRDFGKAMKLFLQAAEAGYPPAQDAVGIMYHNGQGVKKNNAAAIKWCRKAARNGLETAYTNLGDQYRDLGDAQAALANYKLAVEKGDSQAANQLGYIYSKGIGVKQDYGQAAYWFRVSARAGFSVGQYNLGEMYYTGGGVPKDNSEALKWLLISELSDNTGNGNKGLARLKLPQVRAKLSPQEAERIEKAAYAEYLVYKDNFSAWTAERYSRDEPPFLPTK